MEEDLDLRALVAEIDSEAFAAGLPDVSMGASSESLLLQLPPDDELDGLTLEPAGWMSHSELHSAVAALPEDDPSLSDLTRHLGRGASNAELDAAAGARSSADFLRVAHEAGLVGLCDALAFSGLAAEMAQLCAAGITVLAPTDAAFAQLARSTRGSKRLVRQILLAHLCTGVSMLSDLRTKRCAVALGGQTHAAFVDGEDTVVGTARVCRPDISFDGGVIHAVSSLDAYFRVFGPMSDILTLSWSINRNIVSILTHPR